MVGLLKSKLIGDSESRKSIGDPDWRLCIPQVAFRSRKSTVDPGRPELIP